MIFPTTNGSCRLARRSVRRQLEAALDDPDVSEIMINGPGNVWLEGHGRLRPINAPRLNAAALERAAIHIARPLGLDPATTPILDARLDDGSRVAICVPPVSPSVAITVRRFGTRSFSAAQLVAQGALPAHIRDKAERVLHTRRNILVSGGTGSGKTTLLNALIELLPDDERIVAIEDTLELRIDSPNCVRFEARGLQQGAVTIRDLVRHALRHRPDHIVVGEVRGGEAADLLQALNTGHGRLPHHRPRQQRGVGPLTARQLRHAGRRRAAVGRHLSQRGGRDCDGDPYDAPRGAARCRRSRLGTGLRRQDESMGRTTTRTRDRLTESGSARQFAQQRFERRLKPSRARLVSSRSNGLSAVRIPGPGCWCRPNSTPTGRYRPRGSAAHIVAGPAQVLRTCAILSLHDQDDLLDLYQDLPERS